MRTHTKRGDVSAYGLAIGLVESKERATESGRIWRFSLAWNGASYDVNAFDTDSPREYIETTFGKVLAGWAQFDTLTDARKFYRRISSMPDTYLINAECWMRSL